MVRFVAWMILGFSLIILVGMSGAMSMYSKDRVIAYPAGTEQGLNINLSDVDHALSVTYPIKARYFGGVSWSALGSYLQVFSVSDDNKLDIRILVQGRWQNFPFEQIQESGFAWSPDESYLVYSDDVDGTNKDLYRVDRDGQNVQRLFEMDGSEYYPTFSPDGRWIAFHSIVSTADGAVSNAMLYDVTTGEIQPIDPDETQATGNFTVSWSPDSQYIAYVINYPDARIVIAIRDIAEGTSRLLLPDLEVNNYLPVWSADGDHIAFRTATHSYIVDVDGQNLTKITPDSIDVEMLKWSGDGAYLSGIGQQGMGLVGQRSNILYVMDASELENYRRIYSGILTFVPVWQP